MLQKIGVLVLTTMLLSSCFTKQVETTTEVIEKSEEAQVEQAVTENIDTINENTETIKDEGLEEFEDILIDLIEDEA